VDIKINDDVGRYFQTLKGLRQGNPLSPMIFNIVADMLVITIKHAKVNVLIKGGGGSPTSCRWRTIYTSIHR
jgi:hypothetical protein